MKLKMSELSLAKMRGKNSLKGECPCCHRDTLSVNVSRMLFKCFNTQCDFRGKLISDDDPEAATLGSDPEAATLGSRPGDVLSRKSRSDLGLWNEGLTAVSFDEADDAAAQPSPLAYGESEEERLDVPTAFPEKLDEMRIYPTDYRSMESSELGGMHLLTLDAETDDECQLAARRYLQDQHIPLEVAAEAGVVCGWHAFEVESPEVDPVTHHRKHQWEKQHCIGYVNYVEDRAVNIKFRSVQRLGQQAVAPGQVAPPGGYAKYFAQATHTTRPLAPYGIDTLRGHSYRRITLCEGEKDRLALIAAGVWPVISVPDGAVEDPRPALDIFAPWMREAEEVVIFWDDDPPGRLLRERLKHYFRSRSRVASLPAGCKDAADVLALFGAEVLRGVAEQAAPCRPQQLRRPQDDRAETLRIMDGDFDHGFSLGFGPITDRHLRFTSDGSLTIVTGAPGSGKSDWLADMVARVASHCGGTEPMHVAMVSFESPNKAKLNARILHSILGCDMQRLPREVKEAAIDHLDRYLRHIDFGRHSPSADQIIERAEEVIERGFPIDFLLLDPYSRMDIGIDRQTNETQAIQHMLTAVQNWAAERRIKVELVAHPRKLGLVSNKAGEAEMEEINPYSISGSAQWANFGDYIVSFRRVVRADTETGRPLDYKVMSVLKIRDQDICSLGQVFYVRMPSGRYKEFETEQEAIDHCLSPSYEEVEMEGWM